jgi:uncharacterized membrane protein YgdD (TMEM256/DUF423 family)
MPLSPFAAAAYIAGAILALVSVAAAALTSHGLINIAPTGAQAIEWFKIATGFQITHALGMIAATLIGEQLAPGRARKTMRASAVLLGLGALLFPGALYSLSFYGPSFFAPWGGYAAMAGWIAFALGAAMAVRKRA